MTKEIETKNEGAVNAEPLLIAVPVTELMAAWSELIDYHVYMDGRAKMAEEGSEAQGYARARAAGILAIADLIESRINAPGTK